MEAQQHKVDAQDRRIEKQESDDCGAEERVANRQDRATQPK